MTVKDYKDMKEKELNNGRLASKLCCSQISLKQLCCESHVAYCP